MFENLKEYSMIFAISLFLFLIIGSVSASEELSDDFFLESSDSFNSPILNENPNEIISQSNGDSDLESSSGDLGDNSDDGLLAYSDFSESKTSSSIGSDSLKQENGADSSIDSGNSISIEYNSITQEYGSEVFYNMNVFEVSKNGDSEIKKPKYYSIINLRVFTGNTSKDYYGFSNREGLVSFKLPKLSLGKHAVEIYMDRKLAGFSFIEIIKANTKVSAPTFTARLKKVTYFNIKVLDKNNNPLNGLILKLKVFTDKKYKTYTLKTNSKGIAMLNTQSLAEGSHKVTIYTNSKYYNILRNSKIIIKRNLTERLNVLAPAVTVKYKTRSYLNVTALYRNGLPIRYLKLNVTLKGAKASKSYSIKTNLKGLAFFNTKNLSLGTYNVTIKSANRHYILSKKTKVTVNRTLMKNDTPKLISLMYFPGDDDKYYAKLTWNSKKGEEYQVLRKLDGYFKVISTVTASSQKTSFCEKVDIGKLYTYSVRMIKSNGTNKSYSSYDKEGLKLLDRPSVKVDFQNMKANVSWTKIKGATSYRVFRKIGRDGTFKCIAELSASDLSYVDYYYNSLSDLSPILFSDVFLDSTNNSLFYTVRACYKKTEGDVKKASYGLFYKDGDFNLASPTIVSFKENKLIWSTVPNAQSYLILKKSGIDGNWDKISQVNAENVSLQSFEMEETDYNAFYSVQAYALKNGESAYSDFDTGFSLKDFSQENSKYRILYFGDSITYGSNYISVSDRHIFSIPHRVEQLLGCVYYNPSVTGATYHDLGQNEDGSNIENSNVNRCRICRQVVDQIAEGNLPVNYKRLDIAKNSEGETHTSISDYNIVVLSAGTNDYLDYASLGDLDSDDVSTFNGALNHILGKIEEASQKRIEEGKDAIKVVFVDLFYSDRTTNFKAITNRDITPNHIGLLLGDYQNALTEQLRRWSNKTDDLTFYNFKTRDYGIVSEDNCQYSTSDNLHFTKFTYSQYGNAFAQFLLENVFDDDGNL